MTHQFEALGRSGVNDIGGKLETFPKPRYTCDVTMTSDEVTAVCPVTGQPDQYTVAIMYTPNDLCIESKSLKLYLQAFRNQGVFCEQLASDIAVHIAEASVPESVRVTVTQKSRGGIVIEATAYWDEG